MVICEKTLVVSVMTEKFSKDIEKILDSRSANLKALEKNPADGFRLNVCKNNTKRQGSSVSTCILSLIQFVRELLVGQASEAEKTSGQTGGKKTQSIEQATAQQIPNDTASQKSSYAGQSESNHTFNVTELPDAKATSRALKQ